MGLCWQRHLSFKYHQRWCITYDIDSECYTATPPEPTVVPDVAFVHRCPKTLLWKRRIPWGGEGPSISWDDHEVVKVLPRYTVLSPMNPWENVENQPPLPNHERKGSLDGDKSHFPLNHAVKWSELASMAAVRHPEVPCGQFGNPWHGDPTFQKPGYKEMNM